MDTVIYVIVDQLGWEDREFFPALCDLLGEPRRVTVPYFPTLTETAHACFSTGAFPSKHGIIGGQSLVQTGASELDLAGVDEDVYGVNGYGAGIPFVVDLASRDVECFVVAGKTKVAQLLCPSGLRPPRVTRITFRRKANLDLDWSVQSDRSITPELPECNISELRDTDTDLLLIRAAAALLDSTRESGEPCLLFLALPRVDVVGHWLPRTSQAMVQCFRKLDEELTEFLSSRIRGEDECAIVVTGDHGWRSVDTAVWLDEGRFNSTA